MAAYATVQDVQSRMLRTMNVAEEDMCSVLLNDASLIIDSFNQQADPSNKKTVACRMVIRALGDGTDCAAPIGASQGSMTALGYSQSWTLGSSGASGELYMSKLDKKLLGAGNSIASRSPLEEITND